jgi:hypothetical protein
MAGARPRCARANDLQGSAKVVDPSWVTPSAIAMLRDCPVSKWGATACSIALALGCSDSAERQWGSPNTSLDVTEHATDAGFHWRAPSHAANESPRDNDAGLAPDGPCGSDAGCELVNEPQTLTEEYTGECNGDGVVQWGFFTYEATTPGDSHIEFRVRTAATREELGRTSWTDLITAQAAPDTQVCSFFGPAPCPIDLYAVLEGAPRAHHAFAELRVILTPTSDGTAVPSVQSWNLNFSCAQSL